MTQAALAVLSAGKGKSFALFVEAWDVDFALHDDNSTARSGRSTAAATR
ncbi:MAG TPA: hypothetical protein VGH33_22080 [Isosphaeraceae bacterium]